MMLCTLRRKACRVSKNKRPANGSPWSTSNVRRTHDPHNIGGPPVCRRRRTAPCPVACQRPNQWRFGAGSAHRHFASPGQPRHSSRGRWCHATCWWPARSPRPHQRHRRWAGMGLATRQLRHTPCPVGTCRRCVGPVASGSAGGCCTRSGRRVAPPGMPPWWEGWPARC